MPKAANHLEIAASLSTVDTKPMYTTVVQMDHLSTPWGIKENVVVKLGVLRENGPHSWFQPTIVMQGFAKVQWS